MAQHEHPDEHSHERASGAAASMIANDRWFDLITTVLLAISALASAWSAYQASRWSGEQANGYNHADALRAESLRQSNRALQEVQVDVTTFVVWSLATSERDQRAADALRARFRPEFTRAFDRWLSRSASRELPAGTPFTEAEYQVAAQREGERLTAEAEKSTASAQRANQISDNFIFSVVLFTTVGFFGGMQVKAARLPVRRALLILTSGLMIFSFLVMLRLPQNVGF
jgi:hypothetical protein